MFPPRNGLRLKASPLHHSMKLPWVSCWGPVIEFSNRGCERSLPTALSQLPDAYFNWVSRSGVASEISGGGVLTGSGCSVAELQPQLLSSVCQCLHYTDVLSLITSHEVTDVIMILRHVLCVLTVGGARVSEVAPPLAEHLPSPRWTAGTLGEADISTSCSCTINPPAPASVRMLNAL